MFTSNNARMSNLICCLKTVSTFLYQSLSVRLPAPSLSPFLFVSLSLSSHARTHAFHLVDTCPPVALHAEVESNRVCHEMARRLGWGRKAGVGEELWGVE